MVNVLRGRGRFEEARERKRLRRKVLLMVYLCSSSES